MTITCQICQSEFENIIHWSHLKSHNITSSEYKKLYGEIYSAESLAKRGHKYTDAQKQIASQKQKEYATANPLAMKQRTQKALQTKILSNYDFGSAMRGKSQSEASKQTSRENMIRVNETRSKNSHTAIIDKLQKLHLSLSNDISDTTLQLTCNICLTNFQFTRQYFHPAKFKESLCPTCFPRNQPVSNKEKDLFDYIKSIAPSAISSYRERYHTKEIDVYIPEKHIGFEFNGLYWHSENVLLANNRPKTVDRDKLLVMKEKGIRLIQIFEDEWTNHQDIVKSRIANILSAINTTIYARKCIITQVSSKEASDFCNDNHIMGKGRSNARYGLYYEGELVSIMTFTKTNLSRKGVSWELNRFASKLNTNVVGGASRLFAKFISEVSPNHVISYSDNRWSDGNLYEQLGFKFVSFGNPNYWYVPKNNLTRIHRFNLRKTVADDQRKTELELRTSEGYSRIWDCGSSKWIWESKK